jgi:hypothetical protein
MAHAVPCGASDAISACPGRQPMNVCAFPGVRFEHLCLSVMNSDAGLGSVTVCSIVAPDTPRLDTGDL